MGSDPHLAAPLCAAPLGGADFVVVEWSDDGLSGHEWIAPLHVHHGDDEAWYVLEGVLAFQLGSERLEASPGDAVLAPAGTPHTYGNGRPGSVARYLLVMTPQIHSLIAALHHPGADAAAVFAAHDSALLG